MLKGIEVPLNLWWWGLVSYLGVHIVHMVIWRLHQVKHDVLALGGLLLVVPSLGYLILSVTFGPNWLAALCIHLMIGVNYIAIYPAIQAHSPTLRILNLLRRSSLSQSDIILTLSDTGQLSDRVGDLLVGKLITEKDGKLIATANGRRLANFFRFYRRAMALPPGEE